MHVSGPPAFYYFTSISDPARRKWLEEILLGHKLYFKQRDLLNDPNELRPTFVVQGTAAEVRRYVRTILERGGADLPYAKRLRLENETIQKLKYDPEASQDGLHALLDKLGIFCVSESVTSDLLWGHYANGSRGVAIQFDPEVGLFATAQKVTYSNEHPLINRLRDTPEAILQKSMLWKRTCWSDECEWRVIARSRDLERQEKFIAQHQPPESALQFLRSQNGPGHYEIPVNAVRAIVLGVRTAAADEEWLGTLLAKRTPSVLVRRTKLEKGEVVLIDEPRS